MIHGRAKWVFLSSIFLPICISGLLKVVHNFLTCTEM